MTVSMLIHWVRRGETAGETIEIVVASRYGGFSLGFQRRGHSCVRCRFAVPTAFPKPAFPKAAFPKVAFPMAACGV
jgi:hypothetical protein